MTSADPRGAGLHTAFDYPEVTATPGAASQPALLSVRGLTAAYGAHVAVRGLDFDVARGTFFTLLGPSGCGKTTTLMSLAGFERPSAGRVMLAGQDITHTPPERRDVGVVFQDYALFPHKSVLDNVLFPLRMRRVPKAEAVERARDTLSLLELPPHRHTAFPRELSGGQQQRVALARAIVFHPRLLLMDEPLAALDRRLRQSLQFELRRLQERIDTTVIYVTHDQEEALVLSDRIAVMREGRFEQIGPPREVYEQPRTDFVAGFLGSSNTLQVRVADSDGESITVVPDGGQATLQARGASGQSWQRGQRAFLLVRPENLQLARPGAGAGTGPGTGSLPGEITDVAFLGDRLRIEVQADIGGRWIVSTHPRPEPAGDRAPLPGDRVVMSWRASDSWLVPGEPADGASE
jgi:ABC-type Fe3+/spermidine/putrescine transport system ATPase subunit